MGSTIIASLRQTGDPERGKTGFRRWMKLLLSTYFLVTVLQSFCYLHFWILVPRYDPKRRNGCNKITNSID